MPGNTASLTFRLFGIDVNASRTISGVGVAAAGTARDLEFLGTKTLKYSALAGAAGIATAGLGVAAVGAAGALGVGLGGAILGLGVKMAFTTKEMKALHKQLQDVLQTTLHSVSGPVRDAVKGTVGGLVTETKRLRPAFADLFKQMAPLIKQFGQAGVGVFHELVVGAGGFLKLVTPLMTVFAQQLGPLVGALGQAIKNVVGPLATNVGAWSGFLKLIEGLLPLLGGVVGNLVVLGGQVLPMIAPLLDTIMGAVTGLLQSFGLLGGQILPMFNTTLMQVVNGLSAGLARVLPVVGKALNVMLPAVGKLAQALFPALASILEALLPVLSGVVAALAGALAKVLPQLVPAFVGLISVVGQLVKGIQPLLPSLVFLAVWVGKVANNLLSAILPVVTALLGGLLPALKTLLPIIISVAVTVGNALADAFKKAQPSLVLLARAVGQILVALTPLIPVVVAAALSFLPIIPAAAKIASVLAQGLVPIVLALTPLLVFLAPTLVKIAVAAKLWAIAQGILNVVLAANPIGLVIIAVAALAAGIIYAYKHSETFRRVVDTVFKAIKGAVGTAVNFIIGLLRSWLDVQFNVVAGILRVMGKLPGPMGAPFRKAEEAVRGAKKTVDDQLDKIQARVNKLTGKDIPITARTNVEVARSVQQYLAASHVPGFHAKGALLPGYGGGDIVPAMLEPGEAVVPKHLVPEIAAWAKTRRIPGFQMGGLVTRFYDPTIRQTGRIGQSMADVAAAVFSQLAGVAAGGFGGGAASGNVIRLALAQAKRMAASFKVAIALIEAGIVESGLRNLPYGDRDSLGFLQQRPSQGWLHPMNISYAAWDFLRRAIPIQSNYGTAGMLAQAVQRSAFPGRYDQQQARALGILNAYGYDRGGWLQPGLTLAYNGTGRPERVGGGDVHVHFHGPVYGDKQELVRVVRVGVRAAQRRDGVPPAQQLR